MPLSLAFYFHFAAHMTWQRGGGRRNIIPECVKVVQVEFRTEHHSDCDTTGRWNPIIYR
jgi:hypothetical protein